MSALLLVGSDASIRIDDHRTRSRRFLQRGLFLSGIIHLSLVFVFLSLTNRGDEGLVRLISEPAILFPPPQTELKQVPPPVTEVADAPQSIDKGVIDPVRRMIEKTLPKAGDIKVIPTEAPGPVPSTGRMVEEGTASQTPPARDVYTILEVDEPPVAIESPKPLYPPFAKDAGITGSVIAKVLVRADGSVARVEVRGASLFLQTTQETLLRWRFRPARFQGRPVSVWLEVPVNFVM